LPFNRQRRRRYLGEETFSSLVRAVIPECENLENGLRLSRQLGFDEVDFFGAPLVLCWLRRPAVRERLSDFGNLGQLYSAAIEHLLEHGLGGLSMEDREAFRVETGGPRRLLSAIAFEMVRRGNWGYRIATGDDTFEDFQTIVLERAGMEASHWSLMKKLNIFSDDSLLEESPQGFAFRHRSIMEFFAAYWLARYSSDADAQLVAKWVSACDEQKQEPLANLLRFRPIFCFAAELKNEQRPECWVRAMTPFYSLDANTETSPRHCEMICRSWPGMESCEAGQRILREFRRQFDAFRTSSGSNGEVARRLVQRFRQVETPDTTDLPSFDISADRITIEEYRLFDDNELFQFGDETLDDQHAAIVVFYKAWVFARWLGTNHRLPSATELEYASICLASESRTRLARPASDEHTESGNPHENRKRFFQTRGFRVLRRMNSPD